MNFLDYLSNLPEKQQFIFCWLFVIFVVTIELYWWKKVYIKGRKPYHALLFGLPGPFRAIYEYFQGGRDWVSLSILVFMPLISFLVVWGYCVKFQSAIESLSETRQGMSEKQIKRSILMERVSLIFVYLLLIVIGFIGIALPE